MCSIKVVQTSFCTKPKPSFNGQAVVGVATDCLLSLTTGGLPWWPSGLEHCHWLLAVSHHWGPALMAKWSKALPLTACCLTIGDMPWWPSGLGRCHWLLADSHHWGPALMAKWSKALDTDCSLSLTTGPALMAKWSKVLPMTAHCVSALPGLQSLPAGVWEKFANNLGLAIVLFFWFSTLVSGTSYKWLVLILPKCGRKCYNNQIWNSATMYRLHIITAWSSVQPTSVLQPAVQSVTSQPHACLERLNKMLTSKVTFTQ